MCGERRIATKLGSDCVQNAYSSDCVLFELPFFLFLKKGRVLCSSPRVTRARGQTARDLIGCGLSDASLGAQY